MDLRELSESIYETNKANQWDVTLPDDWESNPWKLAGKIALIHSEVVEAWEGFELDNDENVREEIADVAIRAMDLLYPLVRNDTEWKMIESVAAFQPPDDEGTVELLHRLHQLATVALEMIRVNSREHFIAALYNLIGACTENNWHTGDSLFAECVEKNETNKSRGIKHGGKRI